jgi:hypothetical protein
MDVSEFVVSPREVRYLGNEVFRVQEQLFNKFRVGLWKDEVRQTGIDGI